MSSALFTASSRLLFLLSAVLLFLCMVSRATRRNGIASVRLFNLVQFLLALPIDLSAFASAFFFLSLSSRCLHYVAGSAAAVSQDPRTPLNCFPELLRMMEEGSRPWVFQMCRFVFFGVFLHGQAKLLVTAAVFGVFSEEAVVIGCERF